MGVPAAEYPSDISHGDLAPILLPDEVDQREALSEGMVSSARGLMVPALLNCVPRFSGNSSGKPESSRPSKRERIDVAFRCIGLPTWRYGIRETRSLLPIAEVAPHARTEVSCMPDER